MPASSLISTPATWTNVSGEVKLQELYVGSEEFQNVAGKINLTLDEEVYSVIRVQNPFLWGCYQFKKSEYRARKVNTREMKLFHCTAASNIDSIATDNFDWRRTTRSKFGMGVSFSPRAGYANKYANFDIGTERAMILAHVLVGWETHGTQDMIIPPEPYDTSIGQWNYGKYKNKPNVYVKFYDYEFYPSYVAYYTSSTLPRGVPNNRQVHKPKRNAIIVQHDTQPKRQTHDHVVKQPDIPVSRYPYRQIDNQLDIQQNIQVQTIRTPRHTAYQPNYTYQPKVYDNSNDSWCTIL